MVYGSFIASTRRGADKWEPGVRLQSIVQGSCVQDLSFAARAFKKTILATLTINKKGGASYMSAIRYVKNHWIVTKRACSSAGLILTLALATPCVNASVIYHITAFDGTNTNFTGTVTTSTDTGSLSPIVTAFSLAGTIAADPFSITGNNAFYDSQGDALTASPLAITPLPSSSTPAAYGTELADGTVAQALGGGVPQLSFTDYIHPDHTYTLYVQYIANYFQPPTTPSSGPLTIVTDSVTNAVPTPPTLSLIMVGLAALLTVRMGGRFKRGRRNRAIKPLQTPSLPA